MKKNVSGKQESRKEDRGQRTERSESGQRKAYYSADQIRKAIFDGMPSITASPKPMMRYGMMRDWLDENGIAESEVKKLISEKVIKQGFLRKLNGKENESGKQESRK